MIVENPDGHDWHLDALVAFEKVPIWNGFFFLCQKKEGELGWHYRTERAWFQAKRAEAARGAELFAGRGIGRAEGEGCETG